MSSSQTSQDFSYVHFAQVKPSAPEEGLTRRVGAFSCENVVTTSWVLNGPAGPAQPRAYVPATE